MRVSVCVIPKKAQSLDDAELCRTGKFSTCVKQGSFLPILLPLSTCLVILHVKQHHAQLTLLAKPVPLCAQHSLPSSAEINQTTCDSDTHPSSMDSDILCVVVTVLDPKPVYS